MKIKNKIITFVLQIIASMPLYEVYASETFQEKVTNNLKNEKHQQFITFVEENDLFGSGKDRNYTNGIRLGWLDTSKKPPAIIKFFNDYLPLFSVNNETAVFYSLGQNLYTPQNITTIDPDPKDRPYAAFLYGSMGMTTIVKNHIDSMELTLGVVGPTAQGEKTQKFVHKVMNSRDPKGWDYQIKNEPGIMVSTQRLWPELYTAEIGTLHFRTSPYIGGTLGNVYTYANTGLIFQLVPQDYKWQGVPPRVRPSIPGTGYFSGPHNKFSWSIFAGVEGRAIGRNIFLDGNSFRHSRSIDKRYLVGDANVGFSIIYNHVQLAYTLNWRSKEFRHQTSSDLFGAIGIGYRF